MSEYILEVRDLKQYFPVRTGWFGTTPLKAVDGVSFGIRPGETLGLVGESGCGKTTVGRTILHLYKPTSGEVIYNGTPLTPANIDQYRKEIQIVFQDPYSSLNPRMSIGRIIEEPLLTHKIGENRQERQSIVHSLMDKVGIRPEFYSRYPHQFSGGQRQRIAIARALSSQPDVIVLDEPTSALDISVQAQILNLLVTLQVNRGLTYVLISHNVSVIRHMSDRVAVMYLGQIVELGDAQQVLTAPAHPYTRLLLDSLPAIDKPLEEEWALRKTDLPGNRTLPQGCFFYERCPLATHGCEVRQSLTIREDGREIRCWRAL